MFAFLGADIMFQRFKELYHQAKRPLNKEIIANPNTHKALTEEEKRAALTHLVWLITEGKDIQINGKPLISPEETQMWMGLKNKIFNDYNQAPVFEVDDDDLSLDDKVYNAFEQLLQDDKSYLQAVDSNLSKQLKDCSQTTKNEFYKLFRKEGLFAAGERSFRAELEKNPAIATGHGEEYEPVLQTTIQVSTDSGLHIHETNKLMSYHFKGPLDQTPYEDKRENMPDDIAIPCAELNTVFDLIEVTNTAGTQQLAYNAQSTISFLEKDDELNLAMFLDKRNIFQKVWEAVKAYFSDNDIPKIASDESENLKKIENNNL